MQWKIKDVKRIDLCSSCWQASNPESRSSYWKGSVAPKQSTQMSPSDHKALMLLQNMLQEQPLPQDIIFVLSLYLVRCKQLRHRKELDPADRSVRYYEVVQTSEIIEIPQVVLSYPSFKAIEKQLHTLLQEEKPMLV